jgi:hypothetical protein
MFSKILIVNIAIGAILGFSDSIGISMVITK